MRYRRYRKQQIVLQKPIESKIRAKRNYRSITAKKTEVILVLD